MLVGGLLYFIVSFLPWWTLNIGFGVSASHSAWHSGAAAFSVIVFLLAAAAFLGQGDQGHPDRRFRWS